MKKVVFTATVMAILFTSCSKEELGNDDVSPFITPVEEFTNLETSLFDTAPQADLDTSSKGLYHGVFSSYDLSRKGKIYISVGNNNSYSAEVKLLDGDILYFTAENEDIDNLHFVSDRASFTFNALDFTSPLSSEVIIDGKEGYIQAYKDNSTQRTVLAMGTFVDSNDASFSGNWDVIAGPGSFAVGSDFWWSDPMMSITDVTISRNDNAFNSIVTGSGLEPEETCDGWLFNSVPGSPAVGTFAGSMVVVDATSTFSGATATWNIITVNNEPENFTTCGNSIGTWSWNGRSGTFEVNPTPGF